MKQPSKKDDLRTLLQQRVVVATGAMGTYLHQLGFPIGVCGAQYNVTHPDTIRSVHQQYVAAGADVLATNTFIANRPHLSYYGLEHQCATINEAGVRLAKEAGGSYVLGAIGPMNVQKVLTEEERLRYVVEQAEWLLQAGVDGLWFETYPNAAQAVSAIEAVRLKTTLPIVCTLAIETMGAATGEWITDAFDQLVAVGADIVGLNCRTGPHGMTRMFQSLTRPAGAWLGAFPNAGIPSWQDGAYAYPASPQYFGHCAQELRAAGVRLIGGCCGTTPAHIRAIVAALAMTPSITPIVPPSVTVREPVSVPPVLSPPSLVDLVRERHTVLVELDPPREPSMDAFWRAAERLEAAGADAITLADNSLAMTRVCNVAVATQMQQRLSIRPLPHIACRDRNTIGLQSHVYGLHILGIDHVLVVTGDPAKFGDVPGATSVYDMTSFSLIRGLKQMNAGVAFSGKPLKHPTRFVIGCALNPNVKHLHKAIERLEKKIEVGCDFVLAQPVYDIDLLDRLYESTRHLPVPLFIGIMPFTSGRNALYVHNEVPGITLTEDVLRRMNGLEGAAGKEMGLHIARQLVDETMARFKGIYLITPFMAVDLTEALTHHVVSRRMEVSMRA